VQQEFLHRYPESLSSYEKATKVVTTHLGPEHPLVHSLQESWHNAQRKVEQKLRQQHQQAAAAGGGARSKKKVGSAGGSRGKQTAAAGATKTQQPQQQSDGPLSDGEYEAATGAGEAGFTSE
jgi:hypothetical protein